MCVCVCVCAYVCLTTTNLSRRLTMHLNDSSSIALHLKTHSIPKSIILKNSSWQHHYNHHHHHVVLVARISLTLSRHFSLSFIASGRSSGQHPVSSHSCWMYVRAGRPAFARPCVGVHKSISLMNSSLFLQQSGSSNLNSFRDRRQVAVQLVSCGVLLPGLVQDCLATTTNPRSPTCKNKNKIKSVELTLKITTMFWKAIICIFFNIPYFLIIFYFRW